MGLPMGLHVSLWSDPTSPPPAEVPVGAPQSFSVLSSGAGGQGALSVTAMGAGRRSVPVAVESAGPGLHRARFTAAEEGQLRFDVTYDGHPVPGSPFVVDAVLPPDPSKVRLARRCCGHEGSLHGCGVGTRAPCTAVCTMGPCTAVVCSRGLLARLCAQ